MARLLIGLWLFLCLAAPAARASTLAAGDIVTYTLRLPCYQNCAFQGLGDGDKAFASIGVDARGFEPGRDFGWEGLRSFELSAGTFSATLEDFAGFYLHGTWESSLAKVPRLFFQASSVVVPALDFDNVPAGKTVQVSVSGAFRLLTAAPAGACHTALCGNLQIGGDYVTYRPDPAAVPLPATGALLALGLGGLVLLRRRQAEAAA